MTGTRTCGLQAFEFQSFHDDYPLNCCQRNDIITEGTMVSKKSGRAIKARKLPCRLRRGAYSHRRVAWKGFSWQRLRYKRARTQGPRPASFKLRMRTNIMQGSDLPWAASSQPRRPRRLPRPVRLHMHLSVVTVGNLIASMIITVFSNSNGTTHLHSQSTLPLEKV